MRIDRAVGDRLRAKHLAGVREDEPQAGERIDAELGLWAQSRFSIAMCSMPASVNSRPRDR